MEEKDLINKLIQLAFTEDIGDGDHTTLCSIPEAEVGSSRLLIKEEGIIAGVEVALAVFHKFDPELKVVVNIKDGTPVKPGDEAFIVSGKVQSILQTERLVLNILQRMSGIATVTNKYVKVLEGTSTKVLDTRKTTPGMRILEKKAVKIGGGENHRFALYDMIMLKDNHIDFAGGITQAIQQTQRYLKENNKDLKIVVEARNLDEVAEILNNDGVYQILIDNFNYEDTQKAVAMINGKCFAESSGNINEETIRKYAECGVDFISSGALTHSIYNMDLSLKAIV